MQFVKGKPPDTQYATCPGARAKRRDVALVRPGFEPGRIRAWLSLRPSQHGCAPDLSASNACYIGQQAPVRSESCCYTREHEVCSSTKQGLQGSVRMT
jgi:hypothetical protein